MRSIRLGASKALALSLALVLLMVAVVISGPTKAAAAGPQTISQTFSYTGSTATFTVPSGISQLDADRGRRRGRPWRSRRFRFAACGRVPGRRQRHHLGDPGQVLTIGVGQVGASGPGGAGSSNPAQLHRRRCRRRVEPARLQRR